MTKFILLKRYKLGGLFVEIINRFQRESTNNGANNLNYSLDTWEIRVESFTC